MQNSSLLSIREQIDELKRIAEEAGIPLPSCVYPDPVKVRNLFYLFLSLRLANVEVGK